MMILKTVFVKASEAHWFLLRPLALVGFFARKNRWVNAGWFYACASEKTRSSFEIIRHNPYHAAHATGPAARPIAFAPTILHR